MSYRRSELIFEGIFSNFRATDVLSSVLNGFSSYRRSEFVFERVFSNFRATEVLSSFLNGVSLIFELHAF